MAVSYTYQGFCNQIAYELGYRNDLLSVPSGFTGIALSPIQQAVQNAIAKWERERFYFNEITSINNFSTVVGQEFYTSASSSIIGTSPHIDRVWVLVSSNRYTLNPRTEQYLSDTSMSPTSQSQPVDYAMYAETMRLYPIPDGAYPISFEGTQRFALLALPSDTNIWIQDAANLIKAEAKADLLDNVLKQTDLADRQRAQIYGVGDFPGYLTDLRSETAQRVAGNKIRASYF